MQFFNAILDWIMGCFQSIRMHKYLINKAKIATYRTLYVELHCVSLKSDDINCQPDYHNTALSFHRFNHFPRIKIICMQNILKSTQSHQRSQQFPSNHTDHHSDLLETLNTTPPSQIHNTYCNHLKTIAITQRNIASIPTTIPVTPYQLPQISK